MDTINPHELKHMYTNLYLSFRFYSVFICKLELYHIFHLINYLLFYFDMQILLQLNNDMQILQYCIQFDLFCIYVILS